jgi:PAS domain S-box-containing protein
MRNITERIKLEEQLRNFNKELEKQVIEKTTEIKNIFDRVNDGFIAFDKEWRFTYVNKKAGEIYRIDPASIIGKVVWDALPQAIGNPFYEACKKAMKEQRYIHIENYSTIFNYWYESHVYPSPEGLSIYFRDVTERKKSEQLLKSSEETRRLIISSAMDAIVCADLKGDITVWNTHAEKIFGWSETEILGCNLADTIIPERYRAAHKSGIHHFQLTGEGPVLNKVLELYALKRNGEEFPVEISIIPIQQDGTGFFCAFIRDITERKKTETAILKEKDFSEKIIDALPGIFYFFDGDGKFLRWNKQLEIITGYSSEEISKMHPTDFFDAREKEFIPVRMTDAFSKGYEESEGRLLTKDGQKIPFYFTGLFIEYNNRPCLMGTAINITERKKTEKKLMEERKLLRTLIDNLPDYIYVKDAEFRHLINNQANVNLIGATTEEETLGKTAYDYFENSLASQYTDDDKMVFETRMPIINREEMVISPTGEQRWLLTTKVPLIGTNQQTSMIVGISRDITDRKKAEKELRESNERFEMIARTTNDAVWEWNMQTNRTWANDMHQLLYGLDPADDAPDQEEWKKRIHPDERETVLRNLNETLASDKNTWISEYRFLDENNEYKSIYDRTYIVRDEQGKPVRMLGSMMDITARKIAEETLRQNEEKYRLLFSNSPLPMWVYDLASFKFLDVNEAAIRQYGYSRTEFLKMTVKDIRTPDEVERLIAHSKAKNRSARSSGNWKHLKKDGTIIEVEINSHDINYNGREARLVLANDVTDRIIAQRLIVETSEQLRQLSARLQDIREEERMHMAHEIHDELGQRLTVLKMDISWLSRKLKTEDEMAKEKIRNTLSLLDGTIKIVRKIATDLRPGILDDLGLVPALEWQSKEFEERSGIKVSFKSNISEIALSTPAATGLFRIFQESLTNVGRHAQATNVNAELILKNDLLTLTIADDGKGFDTAVLGSIKTLGIMGMKERSMMIHGEYTITSTPGNGTTVTVKLPIKK